jgi:hypothetical protein
MDVWGMGYGAGADAGEKDRSWVLAMEQQRGTRESRLYTFVDSDLDHVDQAAVRVAMGICYSLTQAFLSSRGGFALRGSEATGRELWTLAPSIIARQ